MTETIWVKFSHTGAVAEVRPDSWTDIVSRPIGKPPQVVGRKPHLNGYRLISLMQTKPYAFIAEPY